MTTPRDPHEQPPYASWSVRLADASRPVLLRLQAVPRAVLLILTMILLLGGLLAPGAVGGVLLGILGLLLLWLALLAWPLTGVGGRIARVGIAVIVLGYALAKVLGWV